jgi:hypothetical protein
MSRHPRVDTNVLTQPQQNEMLAKGIPSLTPSAGDTAMTGAFLPVRRFDLNTDGTFRPNGWPRTESDIPFKTRWLHNSGASGSRLNSQQYGLAVAG